FEARTPGTPTAKTALHAFRTIAVVRLALLRILQYVISRIDFFQPILRFLVPARLVRVVLMSKLQIGLADLILRRVARHTQYFVKLLLRHNAVSDSCKKRPASG